MPHHARAAGWTAEGDRMWFHRCDVCRQRRLVAWYYEVYPPLHSKGKESGWWWMCADCLVAMLSDRIEAARQVLQEYEQWEADLILDDEAWGDGMRPLPVLTQALLDRLIALQPHRDEAIAGGPPPPCQEHGLEYCPCEEGGHPHTHNGWEYCFDYQHCDGCHCHLQDERHTACCKGEAAQQLYRERQALGLQPFENTLVDTQEKAAEAAAAFMRATAGEHNEPDFGPPMCKACITEWAEEDYDHPISLTEVGQDWCDAFEPGNGPDGRHCTRCDYPEGMHRLEFYDFRAHRRGCIYCSRAKVVHGECGQDHSPGQPRAHHPAWMWC